MHVILENALRVLRIQNFACVYQIRPKSYGKYCHANGKPAWCLLEEYPAFSPAFLSKKRSTLLGTRINPGFFEDFSRLCDDVAAFLIPAKMPLELLFWIFVLICLGGLIFVVVFTVYFGVTIS